MVLVPKKSQTLPAHHQKRHGNHHKQSKPYHKTYWPYLPLFALAGLAILVNVVWSGLSGQAGRVLGVSTTLTQQELLTITNQDRVAEKVGSLTLDGQLTTAAQAKADDMAANNYWSHVSPSGVTPWKFIDEAGYKYRAAGENLAYGFASSSDVVKGWLNSREHRENLLNGSYQNVGFGVAEANNFQGEGKQTIVVAMYGRPDTSAGFAPSLTGTDQPAKPVVRLEAFAGNALPFAVPILILVTVVAASVVVLRHLRFAHRAWAYGESFIVRHPMLDIALVGVVAVGIIFSRTIGFIH